MAPSAMDMWERTSFPSAPCCAFLYACTMCRRKPYSVPHAGTHTGWIKRGRISGPAPLTGHYTNNRSVFPVSDLQQAGHQNIGAGLQDDPSFFSCGTGGIAPNADGFSLRCFPVLRYPADGYGAIGLQGLIVFKGCRNAWF